MVPSLFTAGGREGGGQGRGPPPITQGGGGAAGPPPPPSPGGGGGGGGGARAAVLLGDVRGVEVGGPQRVVRRLRELAVLVGGGGIRGDLCVADRTDRRPDLLVLVGQPVYVEHAAHHLSAHLPAEGRGDYPTGGYPEPRCALRPPPGPGGARADTGAAPPARPDGYPVALTTGPAYAADAPPAPRPLRAPTLIPATGEQA